MSSERKYDDESYQRFRYELSQYLLGHPELREVIRKTINDKTKTNNGKKAPETPDPSIH